LSHFCGSVSNRLKDEERPENSCEVSRIGFTYCEILLKCFWRRSMHSFTAGSIFTSDDIVYSGALLRLMAACLLGSLSEKGFWLYSPIAFEEP
jgi:hypothetical protein